MATLKSRNTIQLAGASDTTGYYVGYTLEFTRFYKLTGKKTVQKSIITYYDGASKTAMIGGLWMEDVIPGPETPEKKDTYRVIPTYADGRVSTNPAIQSLDYITSTTYGRGLDPHRDLFLPSWLETARLCDASSDVTVEATAAQGGTLIGGIYKYPATGDILFQGKVTSVNGTAVRFTDVIGKLTNKWNSWKSYPLNALVYDVSRLYKVSTAGAKATAPAHTSGSAGGLDFLSSLSLTKVSGGGGTTIPVITNGNPVRIKKGNEYFSGYSLYDADGIDYWRYVGWDQHDQRYVGQHQTNLMVDTSQSLFDNMNSLLEHYGGMLRYNAGKYSLEIEDGEGYDITPDVLVDARYVTANDIISKIKISDEGIRSAYNSLTVAFADPSNKFEARNISFFNSEYLKADRNVPKKGSLSIPGITNYYNGRLLAERFLTKSRFGLTVSLNMSPKGALLVAGRVIQLPYTRYGWTDKKFRITDITHNQDCSVDIVATEYHDSFYQIKAVSQSPGTGKAATGSATSSAPPTNLVATNKVSGTQVLSGIELTWTNNPNLLNPSNMNTEIHMSPSPHYFFDFTTVNTDKKTINTNRAHQLSVGNIITPLISFNGLTLGTNYFIKSVPTPISLILSATKGGPDLILPASGSMSNMTISTATIIGVVPLPETRFFDAYTAGSTTTSALITKYYWIRYSIN